MSKKLFPVGVAQKQVLDQLGLTAGSFQEAEQIFSERGIVVTSIREGKTVKAVISSAPETSTANYGDEG